VLTTRPRSHRPTCAELHSIDDPEALKQIYAHGSKYAKSDWYDAWNFKDDINLKNLFSVRDPHTHAASRRRVANLYSMSALVAYEPFVDGCIQLFRLRLNEAAASTSSIDLGHWVQCYAFDVIGEITVSRLTYHFVLGCVGQKVAFADLKRIYISSENASAS
jgi:hypothetical protein